MCKSPFLFRCKGVKTLQDVVICFVSIGRVFSLKKMLVVKSLAI